MRKTIIMSDLDNEPTVQTYVIRGDGESTESLQKKKKMEFLKTKRRLLVYQRSISSLISTAPKTQINVHVFLEVGLVGV